MSDQKLTWLPANVGTHIYTSASKKLDVGRIHSLARKHVDGRLTLASGTPVLSGDGQSGTTIYYTPYRGNLISLYDGTGWITYPFSQLSLSLGSMTAGAYDLFVVDISLAIVVPDPDPEPPPPPPPDPSPPGPVIPMFGDANTLNLVAGPVWTNNETTPTGSGTSELEWFEGTWVNKHAMGNIPARVARYVGSVHLSSTGTTSDTITDRLLFNHYNRVLRPVYRNLSATFNYTSNGNWRAWNNLPYSYHVCVMNGPKSDSMIDLTIQSPMMTSTLSTTYNGIGARTVTNHCNVFGGWGVGHTTWNEGSEGRIFIRPAVGVTHYIPTTLTGNTVVAYYVANGAYQAGLFGWWEN